MQGVLILNKEQNKTSRDMVNELNHIFGIKKIGHTGTLDPLATGILVMCIGKYTKLINKLSSLTKEYYAQIKVGIKTDTLDITGNILESKSCSISEDKIKEVFKNLVGNFNQTIPKYSAKKINGKKLYEYARQNIEIELPTNTIEIYSIELLGIDNDLINFKCTVSKGTYIRSLIEKICDDLGIIGTMSKLNRTKQGNFDIKESYTISDIKNDNYKLLTIKDLFDYEEYQLNENEYQKVKNGNIINLEKNNDYLLLTYNQNEIAVYKKETNFYKPDIMLI